MIDLQIIAQPPPTFIDFLHKCRAKRSSMTCVTQLILHLSFHKLDQNQYKEGSLKSIYLFRGYCPNIYLYYHMNTQMLI